MILMPQDEPLFIQMVLEEIEKDDDFRRQIMDSVRKIVRLKVCLGLVNEGGFQSMYARPERMKM